MLNEYLKTKDLRKEALKEKNYQLAEEYLKKMDSLFVMLSNDEKNITYIY